MRDKRIYMCVQSFLCIKQLWVALVLVCPSLVSVFYIALSYLFSYAEPTSPTINYSSIPLCTLENYPTSLSWTGNHVFLGYDLGHMKRFCEIRGQRGIFTPPVLNLEICISVVRQKDAMVSTEPTQSSNCGAFCWFCGGESGRVVGTCVKRVNAHVFRMHDSVESQRTPTSSLLVAVQNCGLAVTTIFLLLLLLCLHLQCHRGQGI